MIKPTIKPMITPAAPTLRELLASHAPPPRYHRCSPEDRPSALAIDSRAIAPGAAFVALRGETHDAHAFVDQAIAGGASLVIVDHGRLPGLDHPHVALADVTAAFPRIAAAFYGSPGEALGLAGVTGTNGKTTTAYLVSAALTAAKRPHARLGTGSNWLIDRELPSAFTTPFPLELQALLAAIRGGGGRDVVMEVSSHALAQGRARPLVFDAVGMTSFSQDHLDFHRTMEAYLAAKCLLTQEHLKAGGIAVAAVDDHPACEAFLAAAPAGCQRWRASRRPESAAELRVLRALGSAAESRSGIAVEIATPAGRGILRSPLVGDFNLDNLLVAVGLGLGLGLELPAILGGLAASPGAPGRLQRITPPDGFSEEAAAAAAGLPEVFVDYAHTPEAVAHLLRTLNSARPGGRRIIVLGCGGDRDRSKRPQMGAYAAAGSDRFYATSDNPRTEDPAAILGDMLAGVAAEDRAKVIVRADRRQAIAEAIAEATAGDTVVIAGKGHEDYQIVGDQRLPFSDAEEARRALAVRLGPPRPRG